MAFLTQLYKYHIEGYLYGEFNVDYKIRKLRTNFWSAGKNEKLMLNKIVNSKFTKSLYLYAYVLFTSLYLSKFVFL